MAQSQWRSKRKVSGGRYHYFRGKKKNELAGYAANTKLGSKVSIVSRRVLGGHHKQGILASNSINVSDKKGKVTKTEIINVVGNTANPNLVRRNIMTKGAVVETKLGKARITSRPGQDGLVNGVLLG